jgi:hypothetical protein
MIALRWKILSARLILPEMMGKVSRKCEKEVAIRYPLTAFSAADLIAFDEGAVWLVTMVKSRRGAEWGAPRAGFENSTAGTA